MFTDQIKKFKKMLRPIVDKFIGRILNRRISYAQEGEDLVVDRLIGGKSDGFYVEVGCHDPYRFSNTYIFYKKGWCGICIDPLPGTKNKFNSKRPRDIAIELGVGRSNGWLSYYMFREPALNTFNPIIAEDRVVREGCEVIEKKLIAIKTLGEILTEIGVVTKIDFLSIDVEGFDLDVLKSNNWAKFRPNIIIAECLGLELESIQVDPIYIYLKENGYAAYAKTGNSVIYRDQEPKN